MEESGGESSNAPSADLSSTGGRLVANRKRNSYENQVMKSSIILGKKRKQEESSKENDQMEATPKKRSSQEKNSAKKTFSSTSKGKVSKSVMKPKESLGSRTPKVPSANPSVGLPPLLTVIREKTFSEAIELPSEQANPASVSTTFGRQTQSDMPAPDQPSVPSPRFEWKIVNKPSVSEESQRPPVKLFLKL